VGVETILGFSARLYEVRQLSWRPAQVNSRHFFKALLYSAIRNQAGPVRPGHNHVMIMLQYIFLRQLYYFLRRLYYFLLSTQFVDHISSLFLDYF
jgi:hypothetical protein